MFFVWCGKGRMCEKCVISRGKINKEYYMLLNKFLGLEPENMKVKTEIVAGATTFFTMSYILANLLEPIIFFTNIPLKLDIIFILLRREVYKSLVACLCRLSATAAETPTNKKQFQLQRHQAIVLDYLRRRKYRTRLFQRFSSDICFSKGIGKRTEYHQTGSRSLNCQKRGTAKRP